MMGSVPSSALFNGRSAVGRSPELRFALPTSASPVVSDPHGQRHRPWPRTPLTTHGDFQGSAVSKVQFLPLSPSERVGLLDAWGSHLDGGPVPGGLLSLLFRQQHLLSLLVLGLSAATPLGGPGRCCLPRGVSPPPHSAYRGETTAGMAAFLLSLHLSLRPGVLGPTGTESTWLFRA